MSGLVTPEERRRLARQMLEDIKDLATDPLPDMRLEVVNGIRQPVWNVAAMRKLGEAIIAADDETLKKTNDMTVEELFALFVFKQ